MASTLKPIKLWGKNGPNPPKVAMLLKELNLPYEVEQLEIKDVKTPRYTAVNPNGRIPAIEDPNTGLTLWESGAILEYLTERYDTKNQFSFAAGTNEAFLCKQWLYYQVSGQGPYYGQHIWFKKYHPEPLPSAAERYLKEINRVTAVLEAHLAEQKQAHPGTNGPWLVGNKFTYADLAFIPWQRVVLRLVEKKDFDPDNYPHVKQWLDNMAARPNIKAAMEEGGLA